MGLNNYAYKWRDYDPAIGRFNKMDRFSEEYHKLSPYAFTANNPVYFREIQGDSINVARIQQYDQKNNTNYLQNIITDLNSQTGLSFSVNSNGQLIYQTDSNGNAVISTSTDANGNTVQNGSAEARKIMMYGVSTKDQAYVRIDPKGNSGALGTNSPLINLSPNQINSFINGANNVDNRTMGWGMTFMHEILHSNVAEGGAKGHGSEKTNFGSTGTVVNRMNVIRQELNSQGNNYGNRESYQGVYFNPSTQKPVYIPFNKSAVNQINNGSSPSPNTMFIQVK